MNNLFKSLIAAALAVSLPAYAATLTFDDAIMGATTYEFDEDGDGITDAVLSTTDPAGFNTVGPGSNQLHIQEPGLEGTTSLAPDLRVDFPNGATGSLSFGFALSAIGVSDPSLTVTFNVFDASDNLIGSTVQLADLTQPVPPNPSDFPEAIASVSFTGIASYATLDFNDTLASRYIIDNFTGTFSSTERTTAVPVPVTSTGSMLALSAALAFLGLRSRRVKPR